MLLCSFASSRSRPEKISRWIAYLVERRERYRDDPDAVQVIDSLLSRARGWTSQPGS